MIPDDDYQAPPLCDVCRSAHCACAQTIADIDTWADAYLGSEMHAQDYYRARREAWNARDRLTRLAAEAMQEPTRTPMLLEDLEQVDAALELGDDAC